MDEEASIAQGLRETDGNARYDASCKRILSGKAILARIMKACLEEYKDCDVDEIAVKARPKNGGFYRMSFIFK